MRIDGSGNVGIGDDDPDYKLVVKSADANLRIKIEGTAANSTAGLYFISNNAAGPTLRDDRAGNRFQFLGGTNWIFDNSIQLTTGNLTLADANTIYAGNIYIANRMGHKDDATAYIDFGVGTFTAQGTANESSDGVFQMKITNTGNLGVLKLKMTAATPNNTTSWFLKCDDGNDTDYIIYADGSTATSSDKRQKKNIKNTVINGLETIDAIKVRDFTWKEEKGGHKDMGFIAQELREAYAPAVIGDEDEGMLTISREKLIPVLVKALQEALARIEVLEAS